MEPKYIEIIDNYIEKRANTLVVAKSKECKPKLMICEPKDKKYHFQCQSSDGHIIYKVKIIITESNVLSSCTCPYSETYSGICKHIVASLKFLQDPNNQMLLLVSTNKKEEDFLFQPNEVFLKDELLHLFDLKKLAVRSYSYEDFKIESIDLPTIRTKTSGYQSTIQTYYFNKEKSSLTFSCTCSKNNKLCEHIYFGIVKIHDLYGKNVFVENYFDSKKIETIAKHGYSQEDQIENLFSFTLTTKGFEAKPKFKNIQQNAFDITAVLNPSLDYNIIHLPNDVVAVSESALCFIVSIERNEINAIGVCSGKLNKSLTDIVSSIHRIDSYYLKKHLQNYNTKEEQSLILKTSLIEDIINKKKPIDNLSEIKFVVDILEELKPFLSNTFIYSYLTKNSLIRKNLTPLILSNKTVKLFFTLTENDYFYNLKVKIKIDDVVYSLNSKDIIISNFIIICNNELILITDPETIIYLSRLAKNPEINYNKKTVSNFNETVLYPLLQKFEVKTTIFKMEKNKTALEQLEKHLYLKDFEGKYITFTVAVQYPEKLINVLSPDLRWKENEETKKITYFERDEAFENEFIEQFKALHPAFENQEKLFYLTPEQLFENFWMLHSVERMKQMGIKVFGANELKSFKFNLNKPIISVNLKSDIDWFDIEIDISFGNQKATMKELQKAFLKKSNYVTLGDGTLGILPEEWMKKFSGYFRTGEIKKNGIQISNYQFGIIDELYHEIEAKPSFLEALYNKKLRLQNISQIEEITIPKGIKAKLRDYQHHGLNWLSFLDKNQLGGCLADDMGLGKTLQTIAFLQHIKLQNKNNPPSLIIAPTSLIFNWKNEIEKFCPSLKMLTFIGNNRSDNKENFNKYDLIISTYGSLLNDIEFLKDFKFHYVILDESQAIKNPSSKRYKAVRLLNCFNRIALTGTPIENNTFDLYAQLNFLNPGLLGNMTHYKTQFSDAIDKEKDVEMSNLLGKIISPFMLRRTKEQVATELPEKTENIIFCEMGKEQRAVYEGFKNKYRDYLLNKIDENGVEKSQMYILEGLTKLRQICNSTALVPSEEDFGNYSVKLETLIENIKEKTGNHKILVFSQFVKMLQIVKNRLDEEKVSYEYLDGQTTNRQNNVNNFQNNENIRVFLISLKAGGTGLNLTEADYVFIIDPWWNPAVENQAIDRCYRIGQTKKVMAYRMICKDTIEEKIVSLQQKKKKVATSIISVDDEKKSFNVKEVKELFS